MFMTRETADESPMAIKTPKEQFEVMSNIYLHRVGADDLRVEAACQLDRQLGLARAR